MAAGSRASVGKASPGGNDQAKIDELNAAGELLGIPPISGADSAIGGQHWAAAGASATGGGTSDASMPIVAPIPSIGPIRVPWGAALEITAAIGEILGWAALFTLAFAEETSRNDTLVYHRLESPTQTPQDAANQEASGEVWGREARYSSVASVKAYYGPLPPGARGIEFITPVKPDSYHPSIAVWTGPRPGVRVEGGYAKISVLVTRNLQK